MCVYVARWLTYEKEKKESGISEQFSINGKQKK
jgi:hypothetical protein